MVARIRATAAELGAKAAGPRDQPWRRGERPVTNRPSPGAAGGGRGGGQWSDQRGSRWAPGLLAASAMLVIAGCGSGRERGGPRPPGADGWQHGLFREAPGRSCLAGKSQAQLAGLRFWAEQVNASGGLYVRAMHTTMPVRIVALDDRSSISLAGQDYLDLVQQRHVNVLVSDYGALLTSPAVPIAQQNGVYLFDPTATDPEFFTTSIFGNWGQRHAAMAVRPQRRYVVLGARAGLRRSICWACGKIVILYDTSPFGPSRNPTACSRLYPGYGITPDLRCCRSTARRCPLPAGAAGNAAKRRDGRHGLFQAACHARGPAPGRGGRGFRLRPGSTSRSSSSSRCASRLAFRMVFTVNAGSALAQLETSLPGCALAGTYTYLAPPFSAYPHITAGLAAAQFQQRFLARRGACDLAGDVAGKRSPAIRPGWWCSRSSPGLRD